ncbi:signal peptidase I [Methylophaga sp. 42_25_T18]|nr:signal peptidase I [Methylophaga sp. 42_25_T18]OUR89306.1 signal peptidase I [Methylophaga sp. 42_8_T64]
MVTLVVVTGIIWLIDALLWAPQRVKEQKEPVVVEYARSFFPIILLVLVIRSFIAEPFRIPSASMLPTLHIGDFILVNKFAYGIRLPVLNTKIVDLAEPERGEVLVFRFPKNPKVDYIKRVVGLPGDKVGYFDKTVFINGKAIEQEVKSKDVSLLGLVPARAELRFEQLGENGHDLLVDPDRRLVEGEMVVPDGHYFVMGDNRDNSNDSRFWGTVPEENLVGKAFIIWMSWDWNAGGIVWDRLGNSID